MAYYLKVIDGADEGKTFRIEKGDCMIGRSPSARVVLHDDSVAWEHALIRESEGRLTLQNLTASGTRVRGTRVAEDARLRHNDEIALSERCRLRVEHQTGAGAGGSKLTGLLVGLIVLLLVIAAGAYVVLTSGGPPVRPITGQHWRTAYARLEERMNDWVDRRAFAQEALILYRDAWRLEQAQNFTAAGAKWDQLRAVLLTAAVPDENAEGRTFSENAGTTPRALGIIMGWDVEASSSDFQWSTDQAYADALVWFVRKRAESTKKRAEQTS